MKRLFAVLLGVIALLVPVFCLAQTAPPADPRLAKKITLEATDARLSDLMKLLAKASGIRFGVDMKKNAWSVRERKVHLFVKEVPIGEVLGALKKDLNYSWMKSETANGVEYTLFESPQDVKAMQLLRDAHPARAGDDSSVELAKAIPISLPYSVSKPPTDPALLKEVRISLPRGNPPFSVVLAQLSQDLGVQSLSDQYPEPPQAVSGGASLSEIAEKMPLYKLLNMIGTATRHSWIKEGSVIAWQDPAWFVKRDWDVPQEWMTYFRDFVRKGEGLSLQAMVQMASFSKDQITQTIAADPELRAASDFVLQRRSILSLYGSLSGAQKDLLVVGDRGLPAADLSAAQGKLAAEALKESNYAGNADTMLAGAVLIGENVSQTGEPGSVSFVGGGGSRHTIQLIMPKPTYRPGMEEMAPPLPEGQLSPKEKGSF